MITGLRVREAEDSYVIIEWDPLARAEGYRIYWADKDTVTMEYLPVGKTTGCV